MNDEYTPYRIMKSFVVPGPNEAYLMTHFPGGKIKRVGRKRGWQSIYEFKAIVNSPTLAEIRLFEASKHARLIPQDPGGFDVRDSGIARSIKSSVEGRRNHKVVVAKRKFAEKEALRKAEIEKKEASKPIPKPIAKPTPVIKKKSIFIKPAIIPTLKVVDETPKEPLPPIKTDSDGFVREKREDKTELPIRSGSEVKLESEGEIIFGTKKKRDRKRKTKKTDSFPKNKPDDENQDNASKEAGQKRTEEK